MREGRVGERADEQAHSLSLANACNPYYEHTPLVRDNTSRVSPLCSILRQLIWAGTRSDKFTRQSRDPPGRNADTIGHQWRCSPHLSFTIWFLNGCTLFDSLHKTINIKTTVTLGFKDKTECPLYM
jgi:hypothetical protein